MNALETSFSHIGYPLNLTLGVIVDRNVLEAAVLVDRLTVFISAQIGA